MTRPGVSMLVSATADERLRSAVAAGSRPCPDYLRLEARGGVRLLDWTALAGDPSPRRPLQALRHVAAALPSALQSASILSDGEHVGMPLALALEGRRRRPGHVVIGHRMDAWAKVAMCRSTGLLRSIDRIIVHSQLQAELLTSRLGIPPARVEVVPYGVDTDFWSPSAGPEEALVAAPGREHRDFACLAAAAAPLPARVVVTDGSAHSPRARRTAPTRWPANIEQRSLPFAELLSLYRRAAVVVVPLMPNSFAAGITVVLEAMAAGKAVVVSGTEGIRGVVADGHTGLVVRPQDPHELGEAVRHLLQSPGERARLGAAARLQALERHALDPYVDQLAAHLDAVLSPELTEAAGA